MEEDSELEDVQEPKELPPPIRPLLEAIDLPEEPFPPPTKLRARLPFPPPRSLAAANLTPLVALPMLEDDDGGVGRDAGFSFRCAIVT